MNLLYESNNRFIYATGTKSMFKHSRRKSDEASVDKSKIILLWKIKNLHILLEV